LKSKVEGFLAAPQNEQLSLYEELAVSRSTAIESLQLFDVAMENGNDKARSLACECVREAMNHVRDMCLAASRIERDADDKVSARSISLFISQVIRAIHTVTPDVELAMKIEKEIHKSVRLPEELQPITQTPSETALLMDSSTVPVGIPVGVDALKEGGYGIAFDTDPPSENGS